jgi:O-antigen ligase
VLKSVGIPVELLSAGGARSDIARAGSVGQDAVGIIWFSSLLALSTILGMYITYSSYDFSNFLTKYKSFIIILLIAVILPVISSLMSFGAIAGFLILVAIYMFFLLVFREGKLFAKLIFFLGLGLLATILFTDAGYKISGLYKYYVQDVEQGDYLGTRTQGWSHSLNSILQHPILGGKFHGLMDRSTENYKLEYLSHNIFLDVGKLYGIFGLLMYIIFFFFPVFLMLRAKHFILLYPFFQNHLMFFLFFMTLPFPFYKVFWGFWMFSCLVALRMQHIQADTRQQNSERVYA